MSPSRPYTTLFRSRYSPATWVPEISHPSSRDSLRTRSGFSARSSPCSEVQPNHAVARAIADREPIRADAVPLLNHEAVIFKEGADLARSESGDLLETGHEHAQGVVADHRALRDVRDFACFRHGDREAIAAIDVQHHGNVRLPVSHVHDLIPRHDMAGANFLDRGHFAIARGDAHQ